MLAERVKLLKPSPTLALTAKVAELRRSGADVISFGAGEPDFDTPQPIREAAIQAIEDGKTRYTATAGVPELRKAISEKLAAENGVSVEPSQVVVSCGAKHSMFNALMAVCNPGDEVILVAPFWMTYRDQVVLAGGVPVIVQTSLSHGYVPFVEQIADALTHKTKAIVINSPCNPTGAVYPKATLAAIAELAVKHNLFVISDEIYEKHVYGEARHFSIASFGAEVAERTITAGGVSKSFAMTGWRIGYTASSSELAQAMTTLQDQVTSNASSVSQAAALAALRLPPGEVDAMVAEFDCRRKLILDELAAIPGLRCPVPSGAFYAFADVSAFLGSRLQTDVELAEHLLDSQRVACVPGSVFEGKDHLRLTYTLERSKIVEGVARLKEGLRSLI